MKSFLDFLKEEATFRGNKGIPGEGPEGRNEPSFLGGVDAEGRRKAQGNPMQIGGRMMQLMDSNKSLIRGKQDEIEKFAEKIIRDVYSGFMDNVDLDIKLVRDGNDVKDFMDDENEKKEERNKKQKEKKQKEQDQPSVRKSDDAQLKLEVDKRKLANAITQGEAKNTKEIIRMPECLEGLKRILGDRNGEQLHRQLLEMTELADKMDWIIPVEAKADMMERMPQGMAGACSVDWPEEDEDEDKDEEKEDHAQNVLNDLQDGKDLNEMSDELEELLSSGKPVIRARGVDFVMLIHESVKGIYELIASRGIPEDQELASNVFLNTETLEDEAEDFRYGPPIAAALRNFIVSNRRVDKYPNVREYVYGKMIEIPAEEFLKLMKGVLMMTPEARKEIDRLIDEVIDELDSYEKELNDYEMSQRFGNNEDDYKDDSETPELTSDEEDDDITSLRRRTAEREVDYSNMSPREINDLIDQALDEGDFERVKMLSGYLPKESAAIYLNELIRINESMRIRKKR
jgi:hypothetical protein